MRDRSTLSWRRKNCSNREPTTSSISGTSSSSSSSAPYKESSQEYDAASSTSSSCRPFAMMPSNMSSASSQDQAPFHRGTAGTIPRADEARAEFSKPSLSVASSASLSSPEATAFVSSSVKSSSPSVSVRRRLALPGLNQVAGLHQLGLDGGDNCLELVELRIVASSSSVDIVKEATSRTTATNRHIQVGEPRRMRPATDHHGYPKPTPGAFRITLDIRFLLLDIRFWLLDIHFWFWISGRLLIITDLWRY